jgi:hypothetical protein
MARYVIGPHLFFALHGPAEWRTWELGYIVDLALGCSSVWDFGARGG